MAGPHVMCVTHAEEVNRALLVLGAGDEIRVEPGAGPSVTIGELTQDHLPLKLLRRVAGDPRVPEAWRAAARRAVDR
jgi:hypothetical protein